MPGTDTTIQNILGGHRETRLTQLGPQGALKPVQVYANVQEPRLPPFSVRSLRKKTESGLWIRSVVPCALS